MRRITLLLVLMTTALLAASGVAWAVTKTCPPHPKSCQGTAGADVLKSTSKDNHMVGYSGNDTYTNFVRGNSGVDHIYDTGGTDTLALTAFSKSEVQNLFRRAAHVDFYPKNGKADTLVLPLDKRGTNRIVIHGNYDDTRSKPPYRPGVGYIEFIQTK
jgi:hypothetical protein